MRNHTYNVTVEVEIEVTAPNEGLARETAFDYVNNSGWSVARTRAVHDCRDRYCEQHPVVADMDQR